MVATCNDTTANIAIILELSSQTVDLPITLIDIYADAQLFSQCFDTRLVHQNKVMAGYCLNPDITLNNFVPAKTGASFNGTIAKRLRSLLNSQ